MPSLVAAISALAVLPIAFCAPLTARQNGLGISLSSISNSMFLSLEPITASGGAFYVGGTTHANCPFPAPLCASYSNTTAIRIDSPSSEAGMYSTQAATLYVTKTGELRYTDPGHANSYPSSASRSPFDAETELLVYGGEDSLGWFACPVNQAGQLPYKINAIVNSFTPRCEDGAVVQIKTKVVGAIGAYEYE
ncbi:MAG: hypothetical protein LQ340_006679 [Diploschistes diacapsis]|nr:MAG: hypothetical protein LQ340_006679 [Diploschistes diacapsis]